MHRAVLCCLGFLFGCQAAAQSGMDSLRAGLAVRGGDLLSGNLVSASKKTLRIQPYWADAEVELPISELSHYLQPGPADDPLESFLILHLKSGDTLLAREVSGRVEDGLRVTTLWKQSLTVEMRELHAIRFYDRQRLWAQPVPPDNVLPSLAGRTQLRTGDPPYTTVPVSYPESFLVEMELRVPDEDFQVQIQLFDDEDRKNPGRVVLELSERRISAAWFRRVVDQGFRVESWQAANPVEISLYTLRLYGDMEKNQYTLFLNDQRIKTWDVEHMSTLLRGSGSPIHIRSTSGIDPVWLNALRVLRWSGKPVPPGYSMPAIRSDALLILSDGREVRGTLHEIGADAVFFQSGDGVDVASHDRADVVEVVFPDDPERTSRSAFTDPVRYFTHHSEEHILLKPVAIEQRLLRARAEWTDEELKIPLERIHVLDFQPGQQKARPAADTRTPPHHLRLLNGDQLSGTYLGQDAERVIFQTGRQKSPLRIHGKYVDRLLCRHRPPPPGEGWTLTLSNGDTLSGQLLEKTNDELLLKTEWSDRIRIRMPQVMSLQKRLPGENLLERGPSSMDDWVYSNRSESVLTGNENNFVASTEGWWLTRRGMVQKRLTDVQESFGFSVLIHVPASDRTSGGAGISLTALPTEEGGYRMLQLMQRGDQWILSVTDPQRSGTHQIALPSAVPDENGDIRFVFEFSHPERLLSIRANDVVAHEWKDTDGSFTTESYKPMITFSVNGGSSRLLIREWTLYDLPSRFSFQPDTVSSEEGPRVWLSNGDQLEGAWSGLSEDGHWLITPSGSDESFALAPNRIQGFDVAADREERIKRKAGHVRLKLNGGAETFIAEMMSADAEGIRIQREGWIGVWTIPLEQVERLEFNPYWTGERGAGYPEGARWIEGFR
ncbi:MAG: hypothetical protein WD708_01570 [Kiritimatiellia bacterium]